MAFTHFSSVSVRSWSRTLWVGGVPWVPAALAASPGTGGALVTTCLARKVGNQVRAVVWKNGLQSKRQALPSLRKEQHCVETFFLAMRKAPARRLCSGWAHWCQLLCCQSMFLWCRGNIYMSEAWRGCVQHPPASLCNSKRLPASLPTPGRTPQPRFQVRQQRDFAFRNWRR